MSIVHAERAPKPITQDLRSEPRRALTVAVVVAPVSAPAIQGTTGNVSAHGMDLACDTDLRPATRCEVTFSLPIGGQLRALRLQACVVRSAPTPDGFSLGLVFFGMPQRTQELLESFVWS
ncbi:PilZ domain-containing protein [Ideonella sp.]|uniref:PilZ domain-containing protein n=1 Tax=Ideonella sp. TaxID=1929293 RepID=UPI0035AE4296